MEGRLPMTIWFFDDDKDSIQSVKTRLTEGQYLRACRKLDSAKKLLTKILDHEIDPPDVLLMDICLKKEEGDRVINVNVDNLKDDSSCSYGSYNLKTYEIVCDRSELMITGDDLEIVTKSSDGDSLCGSVYRASKQ